MADLICRCGDVVRDIQAARDSGGVKELQEAIRRGRDLLAQAKSAVPVEEQQMVEAALDAVLVELSLSPDALLAPPPFTPLRLLRAWTADLELLNFGDGGPIWTLQDAYEGVLVLGGTGSGKTSGSGRLLARTFLDAHFGGLVLTVKEDECDLWRRYAESIDRSPQVCVIKPGGPCKFNFLDYQAKLPEEHGGSTENVVELLHTILEATFKGKRSGETFWSNTSKQILRNMIRVMKAAGERLDLKTMRQFLSEAPQSRREVEDGHWEKTPVFGHFLLAARAKSRGSAHHETIDEAYRYWTSDFPSLYVETRSIVVTDFSSTVDMFFDPTLRDLFCGETTLVPEAAFDGAVMIVDLPVKKYLAIGRVAQIIWKHYFQLAVERRASGDRQHRRPVFLWADEAQEFLTSYDTAFQATARSSGCCTVYLSQNMPGFYVRVGGDLPRERIDSLVANLGTKVFHANSDTTTNTWAAEQIGKGLQSRIAVSVKSDAQGNRLLGWLLGKPMATTADRGTQSSVNPVVDYWVQPSEFATLKTGGPRNGGIVEAWFVKSGAAFPPSGRHYFKASFEQEHR